MISDRKKSAEIIICYQSDHALWALQYLKSNKRKNIIILAPTLEAQLELKHASYPYLDWYRVAPYVDNVTGNRKHNLHIQAEKLLNNYEILCKPLALNVFDFSLFKILGDNLRYLYIDILYNYIIYKNVFDLWQPKRIFIPLINAAKHDTVNIDNTYSFVLYLPQLVDRHNSQIQLVTFHTQGTKTDFSQYLSQRISYVKYRGIQSFIALIMSMAANFFPKTELNITKVLMETGGIISSYYYNLYEKLRVKYKFALVTYKLQLYQRFPLYKRNIPFIQLENLWQAGWDKQLRDEKKSLLAKIRVLTQKKISRPPQVRFVLHRIFLWQTAKLFNQQAERTLKLLILNSELLKLTRPKLVINSHDPSLVGTSFVLPANKLGIPTLLLLHGLPIGDFHPHYHSRFLAVWGEKTKIPFKNYGVLPEQLVNTGFPGFDEYSTKFASATPKFLKNPVHIGVFFTAIHPNNAYEAKFSLELLACLKEISQKYQIHLSIRFHEGFYFSGYDKLQQEFGLRVYDKTLEPLESFIRNNDIFISWDTSALLWAFEYQKPVIHVHPNWGKPLIPTYKYQAAWQPDSPTMFKSLLVRFLNHPNTSKELIPGQKKLLNDYAGPPDGNSTTRLMRLIDKLLKS